MAAKPLTRKKRRLSISENVCCFCLRGFEDEPATTLDIAKFDSLLKFCSEKTNDTSNFLTENETDIKEGKLVVKYHKSCRAKFVHPFYEIKSDTSQNVLPSQAFTRSKDKSDFNWKDSCFICGKPCHAKKKNTWCKVSSSVKDSSKMYENVFEAAKRREDNVVIKRLLDCNGDLNKKEARYHRNPACYIKYTQLYESAKDEMSVKVSLQKVVKCLVDRYDSELEDGNVFDLSVLKNSFTKLAQEMGLPDISLKNRTLKRLLDKYHSDKLRIIHRTGESHIVCSKRLSIEEAIKRVHVSDKILNTSNEDKENVCVEPAEESDNIDDSVILHRAAGILRRDICSSIKPENEYFSYNEISNEGQRLFVKQNLLKFLGWLTDKDHFDRASDINDENYVSSNLLAIACDIVYAALGILTPKHLGLSVHLHHMYGSRKLIEDLNRLGYTMSYTELRHFLTSAAMQASDTQQKTESGALIPKDVKLYEAGAPLLIAAGDNWDHNEHTSDGKQTTHAMTSILVLPKSLKTQEVRRIRRTTYRTVDAVTLTGGDLSSVQRYEKTTVRPNPILSPPPTCKEEVHVAQPRSAHIMKLKDLLYNLGRLNYFCDDRFDSPWIVFQSKVTYDVQLEESEVLFNPIIMAPPSNYDTIYTTLKRVKEQVNGLGQTHCPVVFDMGLLAKALEIVWTRPLELTGVHLVEGGMHFLMSVFAGIGYIYGRLGLKGLLTESDVFAQVTAENILLGKDFDRGIKAFLMLDEVLTSRLLINFRSWCQAKNVLFDDKGDSLLENFAPTEENVSFLEADVIPFLEKFRSEGREVSPTFLFWDDYLRHVSTPFKLFLSSSRHAHFDVYEYSISELLPFLFASNRTTYARYMPFMVLQKLRMPMELRNSFMEGNFMSKLSPGISNSVWIDYCLEVTENKSLKSSGGIIGLSHKSGALGRWFLSRPTAAKYSQTFISQCVEKTSELSKSHHADNEAFKKAYNENIRKMANLFEGTLCDPFQIIDPPNKLINFATGVAVSAEMEESLTSWYKKGLVSLETFVDQRLVVKPENQCAEKSFYDPLPKVGIKVVKEKKKPVRCQSKLVEINGEEMYIRLLAINSFKKVSLQRVMSFENAPVPMSLFFDSGDMVSCKKSDFMCKLEELVVNQVKTTVSDFDCIIFDAMVVVQMLQSSVTSSSCTYKEMAKSFWLYILRKSQNATTTHVVFDRYIASSVKSQIRQKRGETLVSSKSFYIQPDMQIPDLRHVLSYTSFKAALAKFYVSFLAMNTYLVPAGRHVVVSSNYDSKGLDISQHVIAYIPNLATKQEEADTVMMLHAKYAVESNSAKNVVIFSPDTDVLVLAIHHFESIGCSQLYLQAGRKSVHTDLTRFIPIHEIVQKLAKEQAKILLPVNALSGCDTTSSFFGYGKKTFFKQMMQDALKYQELGNLGDSVELSADQISICTRFVGQIYGKNECESLSQLRAEKVLRSSNIKPRRLPPTDDSFRLHLQRCLYQLIIWKYAVWKEQPEIDAGDYGYTRDTESGLIVPVHMSQPSAPPELLSDMVCNCGDLCENNCACCVLCQPCTEACECNACVTGDLCCRNIHTILADMS